MEIERLPEELLTEVISRTSPQDACRAAAVSQALRAAADSDVVWSRFLPRDLPRFAKKEIPRAPLSGKGLFQRLAAQPALLPGKLVIHSYLNKEQYNVLTFFDRFSEAAELLCVCWLEIRGTIQSKMLSENAAYTARMVFKLTDTPHGLDLPFQEASVGVGGSESTRRVCLQACVNEDADAVAAGAPRCHILPPARRRTPSTVTPGSEEEDVLIPRRRADGWMEVELGSFYNENGDDGEVIISLKEIKGGHWKSGLVVRAIEIRTKQQA
ncbi:hypothetical protein BRADI_1g48286v3 [Brachypodium distachyon]|uniref:F-box domain-containing protein n=1 Tax=Brachypodium distachyon TaxID=15368 RepID=A0A2K2DQA4_BRADI|nr:hypothetical protein BRADI_1g48286v3 [Brachypodium distachyon]